MINTRVNQ